MRRLAKLRNMQNTPPPVRFECGQCGKEKTPHFRAEYSEWCSCTAAAAARTTPPPPDHDSPRGRRTTTPAAGSLDLADESGSQTRCPSFERINAKISLGKTDELARKGPPNCWWAEERERQERIQKTMIKEWSPFSPIAANAVAGMQVSTRPSSKFGKKLMNKSGFMVCACMHAGFLEKARNLLINKYEYTGNRCCKAGNRLTRLQGRLYRLTRKYMMPANGNRY